jgi:Ca2+/Na+ antiporter
MYYVIPEILFTLCVAFALLSWLALMIMPRKHAVNWWLCGVITPSVLAVVYIFVLIKYWNDPNHQSFIETYLHRFSTLKDVQAMFQNPGLLLVGWLDILAMDLIGGAWQARRAMRTQMPYPLLLFCLLMTVANAPIGMLIYYGIEGARGTLRES